MSVFQVQAKDAIYSIGDLDTINAVQNFSWDPAFNEEYTEELGSAVYSSQSISPEISGSFDVNASGNTISILTRMIQNISGTGDFQGYVFASGTPNTGTVRSPDLEYASFDLIGKKNTNEAFTRAELFPRVFLSAISFSGDANGNASETYSFEGQLANVYRTPYHDIVTKDATYTSSTTATLNDTAFRLDTPTPTNGTSPTHTIMGLQINENIYGSSVISDVSDGIGVGPAVITVTGVTIPVGARVSVWCYKNTPGTFPTIYNPQSASFVRANQIDIWLVKAATVDIGSLGDGALMSQAFNDTDFFLRVQNFDLNIDMRRETLRQIKKTDNLSSIYYRAATYPLQVTASASTLETDLADWAAIQEGNTTPTDGEDILDLAQFDGKEVQLVVRYYYNGTAIQTMALIDARVTGMSMSVGVGGRGEVNWSFTGSNVVIEGADV